MSPLTDEDLGALLNETFHTHEDLADPDRARDLALTAERNSPRSRRGPVLLAAAASVALVVGGTSYLVSARVGGRPGAAPASQGPSRPSTPVPVETGGVTRAQAVAAAEQAISRVPAFPGADAGSAADVPGLDGPTMMSSPGGYTVTRTRWWTVSGATPTEVAQWYADHPARGFVADGGHHGVASTSGSGSPTVEFVTFRQAGSPTGVVTPLGVQMIVETTTTSAGVGVRATVDSVWSPRRADASYARDVTSIDVLRTTTQFGPQGRSPGHSWTITDPEQLARVVTVFNRLPGLPPFSIPCPLIRNQVVYRLDFHSPQGDLVARVGTGCGGGVRVSRNGTALPPALAALPSLVTTLDAAR